MITIAAASPGDADAMRLLDELSDTLAAITGASGRASFDPAEMDEQGAAFVLAWANGLAVGCGAIRRLAAGIAEIKRMYARPGTRGVGKALLSHLEKEAVVRGYAEVWIETRRVNQRAVRFYLRNGYREIEPFGRYIGRPEAICMGRRLV